RCGGGWGGGGWCGGGGCYGYGSSGCVGYYGFGCHIGPWSSYYAGACAGCYGGFSVYGSPYHQTPVLGSGVPLMPGVGAPEVPPGQKPEPLPPPKKEDRRDDQTVSPARLVGQGPAHAPPYIA